MLMTLSPMHPPQLRNRSRGRSRKVSRIAQGRQSSLDRQTTTHEHRMIRITPPQISASAPTASPPPSPQASPPSNYNDLADQIFIAYAHDNFHLAKKLLLELKGVKISGDDDPLIDSVRDEDFDYCFMPNGRVMLDAVPHIDLAMPQREAMNRAEEERKKKKLERLRRCELMWETRAQSPLYGEGDWTKRRSLNRPHFSHKRGRSLISLSLSTISWDDNGDATVHRSATHTTSSTQSTSSRPQITSNVSFKDILACIDGSLFPLDSMEQRHYHTHTRSASRCSPESRKRQLFQSLLQSVDCDKDKIDPLKRPSRLNARSSVSTTSSSALSRASSWLSFKTGSASSVSTDVTTPASSPKSSFLSFPWTKSRSREPVSRVSHQAKTFTPLIPIPFEETPLFSEESTKSGTFSRPKGRGSGDGVDMGGTGNKGLLQSEGAQQLVKQVKKLIGIATAFQTAYMNVAAYSVALEAANISHDSLQGVYGGSRLGYGYHGAGMSTMPRRSTNYWDELYQPKKKRGLNSGGRAKQPDVIAFLPTKEELAALSEPPAQYIPLLAPSSQPQRISLQSLATHPVASQASTPSSSPSRPQDLPSRNLSSPNIISPYSPLAPRYYPPVWRLRPVANPVALRLKALANVLNARGCNWQGRADPGMLGGAQERILGVAIEGGGRSLLGL